MKNKFLYIFFFFILLTLIFLNMESSRYTGINYIVSEEKVSNFKKIKEFYKRYKNYKKLVKTITVDLDKYDQIIKISEWIYLNIQKRKINDITVDSHPWTIVERRIGAKDQFSDLLSVLLVVNNIDSFFISNVNDAGSLTFFKFKDNWSVIDPYYGIYFLNFKNEFCSLDELKLENCIFVHFKYEEISDDEIDFIFNDKNFKNIFELKNYYNLMFQEMPTAINIENTNIYLRGGRSYVQKPLHRLIYQLKKSLNLF